MPRYIDIDKYSKWADQDRPCGIYDVNCNSTTCFECFYNKYKDIEEVAPVVHAKWINKSISSFDGIFEKVFPRYVCTNCERSVEKNFDFCPNCGAKMDKE